MRAPREGPPAFELAGLISEDGQSLVENREGLERSVGAGWLRRSNLASCAQNQR